MIAVIIIFVICAAIVFAALRIVLGVLLPTQWMKEIDRITTRTVDVIGKIFVVVLASGICYIVWISFASSH